MIYWKGEVCAANKESSETILVQVHLSQPCYLPPSRTTLSLTFLSIQRNSDTIKQTRMDISLLSVSENGEKTVKKLSWQGTLIHIKIGLFKGSD
jgi:hypothetical protein